MKVMLQWKARNILEIYDILHSESDFLDCSYKMWENVKRVLKNQQKET